MKRKLLTLTLSLALAMAMVPTMAFADDGENTNSLLKEKIPFSTVTMDKSKVQEAKEAEVAPIAAPVQVEEKEIVAEEVKEGEFTSYDEPATIIEKELFNKPITKKKVAVIVSTAVAAVSGSVLLASTTLAKKPYQTSLIKSYAPYGKTAVKPSVGIKAVATAAVIASIVAIEKFIKKQSTKKKEVPVYFDKGLEVEIVR